jgi:hypothetical protein
LAFFDNKYGAIKSLSERFGVTRATIIWKKESLLKKLRKKYFEKF